MKGPAATRIVPSADLLFLLGTSKLNDLGAFLANLELEVGNALAGRELVLLGLSFDDGELRGAQRSEPFVGRTSLGVFDPAGCGRSYAWTGSTRFASRRASASCSTSH